MASQVDIAPSLGHGALTTQAGVSLGFDAIDDRRRWSTNEVEGLLSEGSYLVAQRALGANMTVDVAANVGDGFQVRGDSVAVQGLYYIAPHAALINVDIAPADGTNPRNDLIVLEVKDDTHDLGGLNRARVRVITGTPNAAAALGDAPGANGTPALPISAAPLAVVRVPAAAASITTAMIDDRRYRNAGYLAVPGTETLTAPVAYTFAPTPDRIRNLVVPTGARIEVGFQGLWQESVVLAARAALFLNANQMTVAKEGSSPVTQAAILGGTSAALDEPLVTDAFGLISPTSYSGAVGADVTTGQAVGLLAPSNGVGDTADVELGGTLFAMQPKPSVAQVMALGGLCTLFAAPGIYDVGVKFKASSGNVTVKGRKLWVRVVPFPV